MARYIDADALESAILKEYDKAVGVEHNTLKMVFEMLSAQPTADVAPVVHGKWIDGYKRQSCSVCNYRGMRSWNYCPYCGAKMDLQ